MGKRIQHLRGRYEEYLEANIVPCEGEIALEEGEDGTVRMKIGNGKTPYPDLPYQSLTVKHCTPDTNGVLSLTFANGYEYRSGTLASLYLTLPTQMREDFCSALVFDSGLIAPSVTYPKELIFYGDDCEGGLFLPKERTRYIVSVENRTEAVYGRVCGVSHDLAYMSYYEVEEKVYPSVCAIAVEGADRLLDVSLLGSLGEANTDGYIDGLGQYDYNTNKFTLSLLWQNGCIADYHRCLANVKRTASYTLNKIGFLEEENGFSMLADATNYVTLVERGREPLAGGFSYRLRARISLVEGERDFTPGESIPSPFKIFYTSSNSSVPMTYLGDGEFEVDYMSDGAKSIQKVICNGFGHPGRFLVGKEGMCLVASKENYVGEDNIRRVEASIEMDSPLHAVKDTYDTLSLSSATITRRIEARLLGNFSLHSFDENFPVFSVALPVPMDKNGAGVLTNFTEAHSFHEVEMNKNTYYFDPSDGNGVLYFSGDENVYGVGDMQNWIYENYECIGYAYKKATESVEQLPLLSPLIPYEGYTFLSLLNHTGDAFLIKQYHTDEKGEEN